MTFKQYVHLFSLVEDTAYCVNADRSSRYSRGKGKGKGKGMKRFMPSTKLCNYCPACACIARHKFFTNSAVI